MIYGTNHWWLDGLIDDLLIVSLIVRLSWSFVLFFDQSSYWLIDLLIDWLVDWRADGLIDQWINQSIELSDDWLINRSMNEY